MFDFDYDEDRMPYDFDEFLKVLNVSDSFRTYGLMYETTLDEDARKFLVENPISEKRSGIRGVCDDLLDNQTTFYAVGVFLKLLKELGFEVMETLDEEWDFCGSMMLDENRLQVSVEFNYGEYFVEYYVMYTDERETQGPELLLQSIFEGGWNLPKVEGVLDPSDLYDSLESFMRQFRSSWDSYKKIIKTKVG